MVYKLKGENDMPDTIVLMPAYGRVYDSEHKILKDWNAGKAFKILGGPYCSIRDFDSLTADFDRVILHWINERSIGCQKTVFEHVLRGNTSYV